jgi:hypothetical protein
MRHGLVTNGTDIYQLVGVDLGSHGCTVLSFATNMPPEITPLLSTRLTVSSLPEMGSKSLCVYIWCVPVVIHTLKVGIRLL